jgi:hypothetical protein
LTGIVVQLSTKTNDKDPVLSALTLDDLVFSTPEGEITQGTVLAKAVIDEVITVTKKDATDVSSVSFKITVLANTSKTASFYDTDGTTKLKDIEFKAGETVAYTGYLPEKESDGVAAYFFNGWTTKTDTTAIVDLTKLADNVELVPHFYTATAVDMNVTSVYDYMETYTYIPKVQEYKHDGNNLYFAGGKLNDYQDASKNYTITGINASFYSYTDWVIGTGITTLDAGSHKAMGSTSSNYSYSGMGNRVTSLFLSKTVTKIADYFFAGFGSKLTSIKYNGTLADWAKVTVGTNAFLDDTITSVTCTDGDATIVR